MTRLARFLPPSICVKKVDASINFVGRRFTLVGWSERSPCCALWKKMIYAQYAFVAADEGRLGNLDSSHTMISVLWPALTTRNC